MKDGSTVRSFLSSLPDDCKLSLSNVARLQG